MSPLSVGNGEFAFTADVTGLQTFPETYARGIPLCTQSQWGWHTSPNPKGFRTSGLRPALYDTHGRQVGYPTSSDGQQELFNWLRENPHRLHLGRIGLRITKSDGQAAQPQDLTDIRQTLDLWTGTLESDSRVEGEPVRVETCCHPQFDMIAVRVRSPLVEKRRLRIEFAFPYGSPEIAAADWTRTQAHASTVRVESPRALSVLRRLDDGEYTVALRWQPAADVERPAPHHLLLSPRPAPFFEFVCLFSRRPTGRALPTAAQTFEASRRHWEEFWSRGGAVELAASRDPRARELERRVVLSQYLTAIQCAGSLPPQETGLTCNSWYGKFHLEMHWWHAAQFAVWNRLPLLERSLGWYTKILPMARQRAREQGYAGARWPKMAGPEGIDSPSTVGPLLIWQQPHPIVYAEMCYQAHRDRPTLDRYRQVVFESAEFMASFAVREAETGRYVLGPPVIPAQENHPPRETWNPAFELEHWAEGLAIAQKWRARLGLSPEPKWEEVRSKLSPLPTKDGLYLAHENCPQTFTERNRDHPSMLAALGVLPGRRADAETMRRTLHKVLECWRWDDTWGWDYPMLAMTAARLGEPRVAVDALMMETPKNRWLPNGHNYQRPSLPLYLPGNGGLLMAVAMMAAGWPGGPAHHAPGFPADWKVSWDGLRQYIW